MFNIEVGMIMKSKSIKKIKPKSSSKGGNSESAAIKAKGGEGCLPIRQKTNGTTALAQNH